MLSIYFGQPDAPTRLWSRTLPGWCDTCDGDYEMWQLLLVDGGKFICVKCFREQITKQNNENQTKHYKTIDTLSGQQVRLRCRDLRIPPNPGRSPDGERA